MSELRTFLVLIPALPLLAAIVIAVFGPRLLRERSHWPAVLAVIGSFLCSLVLLFQYRTVAGAEDQVGVSLVPPALWTWADIPTTETGEPESAGLLIDVTLRADALTCIMLCMVTFISSLVVIYSAGYMHGDRGYWRFFAYVSLFVFSMTMLVSVSNFLLLYVFWEAVGVCSYLLIGFWYQKDEAVAAGKKAFLVNRVGDFGFALAIFLIWVAYGTLNFHDAGPVAGVLGQQRLSGVVPFVTGGVATAICLLLMLGACGKSAQFPLHVWLPDAMEGPTPVSALIHAATMVTAGVYMVTRCAPLFLVSPESQLVVACVGGFTALLAGLIALTQHDLKRVLAYSTISQLGYMFLALGTGTLAGVTAAMFHLFTHAFFKALLFLGSGSVMHAMGNVIDMRRFGGLRRIMPTTHWTFAVGCLALAGIFPFAGFFSKDAILASVHDRGHVAAHDHSTAAHAEDAPTQQADTVPPADGTHTEETIWGMSGLQVAGVYRLLYYVAVATAFLTAFYTFRAFFMTFYGEEKVPEEAHGHAHESPASMCIPLYILAVCAFSVGFLFEGNHAFGRFLATTPSLALIESSHAGFHWDIAIISTLVALTGVALAAYMYLGHRREVNALTRLLDLRWMPGEHVLSPYKLSKNKFFFDEIYNALIVVPVRWLASLSYLVDRYLIDGLVNFCGRVPVAFGDWLRSFQGGLLPLYGLLMALGTLGLILVALRG